MTPNESTIFGKQILILYLKYLPSILFLERPIFWSLETNLGTPLKATNNLGTQKVNELLIPKSVHPISSFSSLVIHEYRPVYPKYCYCINKIMLNEYIQGTLPSLPNLSRRTLNTSISLQLPSRKDHERNYNGKAQASFMSDLF